MTAGFGRQLTGRRQSLTFDPPWPWWRRAFLAAGGGRSIAAPSACVRD